MSPEYKRGEAYKSNPRVISEDAVQAAVVFVSGRSPHELIEEWNEEVPFIDVLTSNFQMLRLGNFGWQISLTDGQKAGHDTSIESIDDLGHEDVEDESVAEAGFDFFKGLATIRALVASAFVEQSQRDGLPMPHVNSPIIDAKPIPRELHDKAYATSEGMYLIDADVLRTQWQKDNLSLYEAVMGLKQELVEKYTPRSIELWGGFVPDELLDELTPEIQSRWESTLDEIALGAYAMFTPNPPKLIPVPVKEGN